MDSRLSNTRAGGLLSEVYVGQGARIPGTQARVQHHFLYGGRKEMNSLIDL